MAFKGLSNFSHSQKDKVGVLITNLGTPDEPTTPALRRYLKQFLSDPRVVEIPRLIWMLILHGIILRTRPKKSAHAYQTVWTEEGSPLLVHTRNQANALAESLKEEWGDGIEVDFAMRYGSPSIDTVVQSMLDKGVRRLVVMPLYPQYSGSTTASTFDVLAKDFQQRRWIPELRFVTSYYDNPLYIKALADKVRAYWDQHGKADKLVLSYHGVPRFFLEKGDPYYCHCQVTSRLLIEELGVEDDSIITTFQSRFGKAEWLKPYTDKTLQSLPDQGVKSVQVMCPGFSSDCLETIEEIAVENRDYFLEAGGEKYDYIPALNDDKSHINVLSDIASRNLSGWAIPEVDYEQRAKRAASSPLNNK